MILLHLLCFLLLLALHISAQPPHPPHGRPPPRGGGGWPPPHHRRPPPRWGGGLGENFGQGISRRGGFGRPPWGGRGGGRGQTVDLNNVDGGGEFACSNGRPLERQPSAYSREEMEANVARIVKLIENGRCQRPIFPGGRCYSNARMGRCDSSRSHTESVYVEKVDENLNLRLILTNGIPDHCYQKNQQRANPNNACEHYAAMLLPLNPAPPSRNARFREHRMGPVGVAKSGAFLYNHKSAEAVCNVAALVEKPTFDPCDGHADPVCRYHYHKAPVCMDGWDHCGIMGYMNDGFPVYGKCTVRMAGRTFTMKSGYKRATGSGCDASHYRYDQSRGNLDQANGFHFTDDAVSVDGSSRFRAGDYAYFFTPEYPFVMAGTFSDTAYDPICFFDPGSL